MRITVLFFMVENYFVSSCYEFKIENIFEITFLCIFELSKTFSSANMCIHVYTSTFNIIH